MSWRASIGSIVVCLAWILPEFHSRSPTWFSYSPSQIGVSPKCRIRSKLWAWLSAWPNLPPWVENLCHNLRIKGKVGIMNRFFYSNAIKISTCRECFPMPDSVQAKRSINYWDLNYPWQIHIIRAFSPLWCKRKLIWLHFWADFISLCPFWCQIVIVGKSLSMAVT